jgi:hypothetical protein
MVDDALQRLIDIEAIKQLKGRYFYSLDNKDWSGWTSVFTEDLHFEGDGFVYDGRDELLGFASTSLEGITTVHHGHSPVIVVSEPNRATGTWAFEDVVVRQGAGDFAGFRGYGYYRDEYVRTSEGWRISRFAETRLWKEPLAGTKADTTPPVAAASGRSGQRSTARTPR